MLIACMNELKDAIAFAQSAESQWPQSMRMPDGQFVMTCAYQRVREVLDLTRLSKAIPCYDAEAEALEALKSGQSASSAHGG